MNTIQKGEGRSSFPVSHYHGISMMIDIEVFSQTIFDVFEDVQVDIARIRELLCPNDKIFIMRMKDSIQHIFSELYTAPDEIKYGYLKLKVLELVLFLSAVEETEKKSGTRYYLRSQVEKIKSVEAFMKENLERNFTQKELAQKFGISLTSLKDCFRGIYGKTIFSYMRSCRMNVAAKLLKETDENISGIAQRVGYENAGKFSSAFQKEINLLPSEYRNIVGRMDYKGPYGEEK